MTNLRLWVALLALTTFLAGLACGPFVSAWILPPNTARDQGPFPDYEMRLIETFHLGPERRGPLRAFLTEYRDQVERTKDLHMADYMSSMEAELREHGVALRERIRDKVLPESARSEFDRLALAFPGPRP